jgi:two-component system, OmpR family, alkaline phosphatase synthesis response regulator PhoP
MENPAQSILLVDDEEDILEFLSYNLKKEGYKVYTAINGLEAIGIARAKKPDLIILDVMMPQMDGIETCEKMRSFQELSGTVIAFLTARSEDYSEIAGFGAGADDYISKPVKPKVFISRVKALLKRAGNIVTDDSPGILQIDHIKIDAEKHIVSIGDQELVLPKKEFNLLHLLATKPDKVFTRDEIYNKVWGTDIIVGDRTIDVHIRKLREKLGEKYIDTIKGIGYKFHKKQ